MQNWYVLAYTSNRLRAVEDFLNLKCVDFYNPEKESRSYVRPDKQCCVRKSYAPVFPGYLFVNMNFNELHPEKLAAFRYIYGLITFGDGPLPVDVEIINALKEKDWNESPFDKYKGLKRASIPHEFAAILLMEEPVKRSIALLKYLTDTHEYSLKEVKHAS